MSRMRLPKFEEKPVKKLTINTAYMVKPGSRLLVPHNKLINELETYKHKAEIKPRKHNIMRSQDEAARAMGLCLDDEPKKIWIGV